MVFTWIARDLEFTSHSDWTVEFFAFIYTLIDFFVVLFKVQGIIVETTKSHFNMQLSKLHCNLLLKYNNSVYKTLLAKNIMIKKRWWNWDKQILTDSQTILIMKIWDKRKLKYW